MNTLPVEKEKAIAAYKNADPGGKSLLSDLFGKAVFLTDMKEWEAYIIPRVNSFEDACKELGEDPEDERYSDGEADEISYKRGKVVVRALNGPWVLDWQDRSQHKYRSWMEFDGTGFRFNGTYYGRANTYTTGGSRLHLCSDLISKHFATKFGDLMAPFWI